MLWGRWIVSARGGVRCRRGLAGSDLFRVRFRVGSGCREALGRLSSEITQVGAFFHVDVDEGFGAGVVRAIRGGFRRGFDWRRRGGVQERSN